MQQVKDRLLTSKSKKKTTFIYNNNNYNSNNLFIYTIQVQREEKTENTRNYRKRNDINYIICTIFESVCNMYSQSSKAFELAAAYLQVKKGTKERNNN